VFDEGFSFHNILTMLRCWSVIVLFCLVAIQVLAVETRVHLPEENVLTILNDPLSDNHRKLLHAFTGYRHRFEQSPNFKALRWGLGNIQDSGVCDLCEIGAPVVSEFLDFQNENLFLYV
jgi:hypothetical protein